MNKLFILFAFLFVSFWNCTSFPHEQENVEKVETVEDADSVLATFICLGQFVDRGVAVSPFFREGESGEGLAKEFNSLPVDVQLFLSHERISPQIAGIEFPWGTLEQRPLGGEALNRFCRLGLIDIIYMKGDQLFAPQIATRMTLKKHLARSLDQARMAHLTLSSQSANYNEDIVAAAMLRRMSIDVDSAICSVLSNEEKIRLAKILVHVIPVAKKIANRDRVEYELGSSNLKPATRGE